MYFVLAMMQKIGINCAKGTMRKYNKVKNENIQKDLV